MSLQLDVRLSYFFRCLALLFLQSVLILNMSETDSSFFVIPHLLQEDGMNSNVNCGF